MNNEHLSTQQQALPDKRELENKVKAIYTDVALHPEKTYHFAMGRPLALQLGYPPADLDRAPAAAVESFAGVGWHCDFASIRPGDVVLDLGSGSGMDSFIAAWQTGDDGQVFGIEMTTAQLKKSENLARESGIGNIRFIKGYIEELFFDDNCFDVVISNGVINLSAEKEKVFRQIARVLKPGGRVAISDIVTELPLPPNVSCDASLWAACIGGAAQQDDYRALLKEAGLEICAWRVNEQYHFLSRSAVNASRQYGVRSVSLLAIKL